MTSTVSIADAEGIKSALAPRLAAAGSRKEKTREAASVIFFTFGIHPSAKTVREFTQHGSLTDINEDLREFWADLRTKTRVKIDAPMLPSDLSELFSDGLAKVWELAADKAHSSLDGERKEAAESIDLAQRSAFEAKRQQHVAEEDAEASRLELREERERRSQAEGRLVAQEAEIVALQDALATWQNQAEASSRARQESEERFARELDAERVLRRREADMFEGDIKFAKMQIDEARTNERELRARLKAENEAAELELVAYRQRANRSEEALGLVRLEFAELQARYQGLELRFSDLSERVKKAGKVVARSHGLPDIRRRRTLR